MTDFRESTVEWDLVETYLNVVKGDAEVLPQHRHDLGRERVGLIQRARILVATTDEVFERGYGASSGASIRKRAGVSSRTFYEHYADKEEAFLGLFAILDAGVAGFAEAIAEPLPVAETVRAGVRRFLAIVEDVPRLTHVLLVDAAAATPRISERRREAIGAFAKEILLSTDRWSGTQPVLVLPETLVIGLVSGVSEFLCQQVIENPGGSFRELEDLLVAVWERLLLP